MDEFNKIESLRTHLGQLRGDGESIAFVPTMGNLHQGHLELVRQARQLASVVVVSIYVNPTQFGEGEDFDDYPRTLQQDRNKLESVGADVLFTPSDAEIYPHGTGDRALLTRVEVPGISDQLCGSSRPGHFVGAATVVTKLLNIVQPKAALFGRKDYQQLLVIRRLVEELNLPVEVIGVPTWREQDGLAMSSRNRYLTSEEREQAPLLYQTLQWVSRQLEAGREDYIQIEQEGESRLQQAMFVVDYLSVMQPSLLPAQSGSRSLIVLAAANMGSTRLIDNCMVNLR